MALFLILAPFSRVWADAGALLREGYAAYVQGQWPEAEAYYRQACREDPRNAAAFYGVGLCEYQEGRLSDGEEDLRRAVALNPSLERARTLLDRVHGLITEQQVRDLQFSLLMKEGVMFYRMRRYDKAKDTFEKAAALNPVSTDLHFNMGLVYMRLKLWDKARAELEQCLKLDPGNKRAQYALGVLYEKLGGTAEAQNYFLSVAQSPSAGLYNLEAMRQLSTLHSESPDSPFHFSLRLQGGGAQNTVLYPNPAVPIPTNTAVEEYGHLQLTYSPLIGKTLVNFSYGGDGLWSQVSGQGPYFAQLHDFSVGSAIPLPSNWRMPLAYDEQIGFNSTGDLYYQHHQASAAFQWLFSGQDLVQVQAQYLRELYPPPVGIDTNNWIGSVSSSIILGAHSFNLSYSFRECLADTQATEFDNYYLNSLSLIYHVEFGGGWNATLNYTPQWQDYPFFYDTNGNPRSDWIQNLSGEFTIPLEAHWNFVVGDQYQDLESTYQAFSQHSNNFYAATQFFF